MSKCVSAALALYSFFLIQTSMPHLPSRMPTHFNLAGQADGWGSPQTLWVMLVLQVLVAGVMLSIPFWGRRYPGSVHLGTRNLSDFTPAQLERVWPLLDQMASGMSIATSLFFVYIIREIIRAAGSANPRFHQGWAPLLLVGAMAGLAVYYIWRINKEAQEKEQ